MSAAMQIDEAAITASATAAIDRLVADTAKLMVADPSRIARAIFTEHLIAPRDKSLAELRQECGRRLEALRRAGRSGHWTYSISRHLGAKAAKVALDQLLGAEASV